MKRILYLFFIFMATMMLVSCADYMEKQRERQALQRERQAQIAAYNSRLDGILRNRHPSFFEQVPMNNEVVIGFVEISTSRKIDTDKPEASHPDLTVTELSRILLDAGYRKYPERVNLELADIRNMKIQKSPQPRTHNTTTWTDRNGKVHQNITYTFQTNFYITGDIVHRNPSITYTTHQNVQQVSSNPAVAVTKAAEEIIPFLKSSNRIAVVNFSTNDQDLSEFVVSEIEHILTRRNFTVVDRTQLNRIRREQNMHLSGEVEESTIVDVGRFSGADIVITGGVTGTGEIRRLRLRVISVEKTELITTVSQPF